MEDSEDTVLAEDAMIEVPPHQDEAEVQPEEM